MKIYLAVVEDIIVQRREYVVLGESSEDVKEKILQGFFMVESEPAHIDNDEESKFISIEEVGKANEG